MLKENNKCVKSWIEFRVKNTWRQQKVEINSFLVYVKKETFLEFFLSRLEKKNKEDCEKI